MVDITIQTIEMVVSITMDCLEDEEGNVLDMIEITDEAEEKTM